MSPNDKIITPNQRGTFLTLLPNIVHELEELINTWLHPTVPEGLQSINIFLLFIYINCMWAPLNRGKLTFCLVQPHSGWIRSMLVAAVGWVHMAVIIVPFR
uniref:Uncharacterized protein n=1 Tax=Cacopsylla melanoneura TaxID=428564 RepID=A0A8D9ATS9_9HEMI